MKVETAVARAAKGRRFERKGDAWYSISIATNSGSGRFDEAEALAHHHRLIGFDALRLLGYDEDQTHDFDWHLWPTATPMAFVQQGIREWAECEEAHSHINPFHALVAAMVQA